MVVGLVAQLGIAAHKGLDLRHQVLLLRSPLLRVGHEAVLALREGEELPLEARTVEIAEQRVVVVDGGEFAAVAVKPGGGEAHRRGLAVAGHVERAGAGGVHGHEDVGQDAALLHAHAVGGHHFAALVAAQHFIIVILGIRLLDAAAGGRVVARHGDAHTGPVAEEERLLHEALAEGAAAVQTCAAIVLQGAGEDLAGGSGSLVHKELHAQLLEGTGAVGAKLFPLAVAAFEIDDHRIARQEEVGQLAGLVKIAARVVAQVENELAHPLGEQLSAVQQDLVLRGAGELRQAHVARGVADHEGRVHRPGGNLAAGDLERDHLPAALHGHEDLAAGHTLDATHHAVLREMHPRDVGIVDLEQAVAWLQADLLGRTAGDDFDHHGGVVGDVELDADAVEITHQVGFGLFEHLRGHIGGMRVQGGQGGRGDGVADLGAVHAVHVVLIDALEDERDLAPVVSVHAQHAAALADPVHEQGDQQTDDDAQQGDEDGRFLHTATPPRRFVRPLCRRGAAGRCRP